MKERKSCICDRCGHENFDRKKVIFIIEKCFYIRLLYEKHNGKIYCSGCHRIITSELRKYDKKFWGIGEIIEEVDFLRYYMSNDYDYDCFLFDMTQKRFNTVTREDLELHYAHKRMSIDVIEQDIKKADEITEWVNGILKEVTE